MAMIVSKLANEFDERAKLITHRMNLWICKCGINQNYRISRIDGVEYALYQMPMRVDPDDPRCAHRQITMSLCRAYRRGRLAA